MAKKWQINKLQKIQTKCLKLVLKSKQVWPNAGFLTINKLLELESAKLGYKLVNGLLPSPIASLIRTDQVGKTLNKTHRYGTRNKKLPNTPVSRTNLYKNSFLTNCVKSYSTFLVTTADSTNIHMFVRNCKQKLHA